MHPEMQRVEKLVFSKEIFYMKSQGLATARDHGRAQAGGFGRHHPKTAVGLIKLDFPKCVCPTDRHGDGELLDCLGHLDRLGLDV
jgi:hypothetical protein